MAEGSNAWHLIAVVNEPLQETLRFASWYLDLGARSLILLFDNPDDPAIPVLSPHPAITCIPCTTRFWRSIGIAARARFPKRQIRALTWAYHQLASGWVLSVDADEFLFANGGAGDIRAALAGQGSETQALRIETAEVVPALERSEKTVFRTPMPRAVRRDVYGEDVPLFGPRRMGLVGHPQGKSFIRAGQQGIYLRQHWAHDAEGQRLPEVVLGAASGLYLLHYLAPEYEGWRRKMAWRLASSGFTKYVGDCIREIEAAGHAEAAREAALLALYNRLHRVRPEVLARMRAHGVCLEAEVDTAAPLARMLDLSVLTLPGRSAA